MASLELLGTVTNVLPIPKFGDVFRSFLEDVTFKLRMLIFVNNYNQSFATFCKLCSSPVLESLDVDDIF